MIYLLVFSGLVLLRGCYNSKKNANKLNVDGGSVTTFDYVTESPSNFVNWDRDFVLGARSLNNPIIERHFNGEIDDVRIYGRALSAKEVWYLHKEGLN